MWRHKGQIEQLDQLQKEHGQESVFEGFQIPHLPQSDLNTHIMKTQILYRLPIRVWSATDYACVINNDWGWVSDCEKYWEFSCAEDMQKFKRACTR